MITLGDWTVYFSEKTIYVEKLNMAPENCVLIKKKIKKIKVDSGGRINIEFTRGKGYIEFFGSNYSDHKIHIEIPRFFFGRRIIDGGVTDNEKRTIISQLGVTELLDENNRS